MRKSVRSVRSFLLCLTFLFLYLSTHAQISNEKLEEQLKTASYSDKFATAQSLMDEKYYNQALKVWLHLLEKDPDNANLNYKVGYCYFHSFSERYKAYAYFNKAAEKTVKNYNPYLESEKSAPYEAKYFYATSLHREGVIDKAEAYFKEFIGNSHKRNIFRPKAELSLIQIANARKILQEPKDYIIKNIGDKINSPYPEYSPVISLDGNLLFFTSRRLRADSSNLNDISTEDGGFFEDIYYSRRQGDGTWSDPVLADFSKTYQNEASVSVSADGQKLYVYRDDAGIGNLYFSDLEGASFSELKSMPSQINTNSWETHLTSTPDGNTIYFVSDREGGLGGRDIWRITKLPNGEWSEPYNIGAPINTPYDEDSPYIGSDSKTLFFSSNGERSMGGFDMFVTQLDEESNTWGEPENMGVPVNSFGDDLFYSISADGFTGYYSSIKEDGAGEKDIYMIQTKDSYIRNVAILKGFIKTSDGSPLPENIVINVKNLSVGGKELHYTPRKLDGGYILNLLPCQDYYLEYLIDGELFYETHLEVPCQSSYQEINRTIIIDMITLKGQADGEYLAYENLGGLRWQLRKLGYDDSYIGLRVLFTVDGQIMFEEFLNKFGEFEARKLDPDKAYIVKILDNDDKFCGEMELKLFDENDNIVEVAVQVDLCDFLVKPSKGKDTTTTDVGETGFDVLSYIQFFGYNKNILRKEAEYNEFIESLAKLVKSDKAIKLDIIGSASKVPTSSYKSNQKLANKRASEAKKKIITELKSRGANTKNITFTENAVVQGPDYNNDAQEKMHIYKKYQYIKIEVKPE